MNGRHGPIGQRGDVNLVTPAGAARGAYGRRHAPPTLLRVQVAGCRAALGGGGGPILHERLDKGLTIIVGVHCQS